MKFQLFFIILLALLTSCTSKSHIEPTKNEGTIVTISAMISQETRVTYSDSTLKIAWETGDQLLMAGYDEGENYVGCKTFTWNGGNNFTGTPVEGAITYKAYYPAGTITLDLDGNIQPFTSAFWQQTQNGNNTTEHLRNKLLLFDEAANPINEPFSLALKSSIIKFNLKGIPTDIGTLSQLIWTVETAPGVVKSIPLNVAGVTLSTAFDSITAFLAFDPTVMKISGGGKVRITLLGEQPYEWSTIVTSAKNYTPGNRYTSTVSNGWTEKEIINPLSHVAEYNVDVSGTGFVTDITACEGSGYFTWNDAITQFGDKTIGGVTYHLPSIEEWRSVVPQNMLYVLFGKLAYFENISENVVVQGQSITMTSDYQSAGSVVAYALRYKGTDMLSAWMYEYIINGNDTHIKISSLNVAPSVTIDDISNDLFWAQTNNVSRCFPAGGYKTSGGYFNRVGTFAWFWSSTEYNNINAWSMTFHGAGAYSNYSSLKNSGFPIRLFTN